MTDMLRSTEEPLEAADGRFFYDLTLRQRSAEPRHVVSSQQFSPEELTQLFCQADELRALSLDSCGRRELAGRHVGRQLCSLFYEPSTRTRLSFEQAAAKLGMGVVSTENALEFSSATKGETIEDSVRVLGEYDFGVIVLRHHETGAARRAAAVSVTPIINAGDGKGEHPTQALLDTYTIQREKGRLDRLHVVMGGDLKHGRTVRSLARLLARFPGNHISFVSTPGLRMEEDILSILDEHGSTYDETLDMADAERGPLRVADVVYWTRTQTERFSNNGVVSNNSDESFNPNGSSKASEFVINQATLGVMKPDAIIMHPLPRVWEIAPEVDSDSRAVYFQQAGNGLYVRMALLDSIMSR